MAKRKLSERLIDKSEIKEELGKIEESDVDFVTKSGKVYCDYGNNKFLRKTVYPNKHNGYYYVGIKSKSGTQIQRRIHIFDKTRCFAKTSARHVRRPADIG